jgi:imidazoleglycerol phosphate synthase glutamine amidotransferase subunit HisH
MQLLGASSEETPGVAGLGIVDVGATRFPAGVTVPHFGWNTVDPESGFGGCERGYAYFANSYRFELGADDAPEGWAVATSDHGGRFIAAMRRGAVLACQFHPELSGAWGAALIRGWAEYADRPRGPSPAPRGAAC